MARYIIGAVLFNLIALVVGFYWSRKHHKDLHAQCATRAFHTCDHCHHLISRHFIDGYGRTTCKTCKVEGFKDAEKRGKVIG
jgi:hypothetical protein